MRKEIAQLILEGKSLDELKTAGATAEELAVHSCMSEKDLSTIKMAYALKSDDDEPTPAAEAKEKVKQDTPDFAAIFGKALAEAPAQKKEDALKREKHLVAETLRGLLSGDKDRVAEAQKALKAEFPHKIKALTGGNDALGGAFTTTGFIGDVARLTEQYSTAMRVARTFRITDNSADLSNITGKAIGQWTAAGAGHTAATDYPTERKNVTAHKLRVVLTSDAELVEDDATDEELWDKGAEKIAEAIAKDLDDAFYTGTGTGQPLGLLNDTDPNIVVVTMAATRTSFTDANFDDFNTLKYSLPPSARSRGIFVVGDDYMSHLETLKDQQGQYIYRQPSDASGVGTMWGRPVINALSFPGLAADAVDTKFAMFIDPENGAAILERVGMTLKQASEGTIAGIDLLDTDRQALIARVRRGSGVRLGAAIAFLKTAAA